MARATAERVGQLDRFRYSPGDGHMYVWPAGDETTKIVVYRIMETEPSFRVQDTGDRIDVKDTARTATAMAERVDRWRAARQVTPVP